MSVCLFVPKQKPKHPESTYLTSYLKQKRDPNHDQDHDKKIKNLKKSKNSQKIKKKKKIKNPKKNKKSKKFQTMNKTRT